MAFCLDLAPDHLRMWPAKYTPTNLEDFTSASKCARMKTVPASCIMQKAIGLHGAEFVVIRERQGKVWMEERSLSCLPVFRVHAPLSHTKGHLPPCLLVPPTMVFGLAFLNAPLGLPAENGTGAKSLSSPPKRPAPFTNRVLVRPVLSLAKSTLPQQALNFFRFLENWPSDLISIWGHKRDRLHHSKPTVVSTPKSRSTQSAREQQAKATQTPEAVRLHTLVISLQRRLRPRVVD